VFLFAERLDLAGTAWSVPLRLYEGMLARALPIAAPADPRERLTSEPDLVVDRDPYAITLNFKPPKGRSPFMSGGVMIRSKVWTRDVRPAWEGPCMTLGDVVSETQQVPASFYLDGDTERWRYLKGPKNEPRVHKASGFEYQYSEGGMVFPDPLDRASRTILTGEGGSSPSRFKHVVEVKVGRTKRLRRLVPEELERLNGFPQGWTDYRMTDVKRAFMMGNALVVGVLERIGRSIIQEMQQPS
jgi:DNA (cytosine-5)-methyltransferase 1